ncbi:MAG: hypothetical protein JW810_02520, partial [Sedimentisphaerales bacterium]|nr:hypothetical protein [Sedimentisphaerales bacterium]
MNKIPLWKRVGGWLRRSHEPVGQGKVIHVDAEGLLVDPEGQNQSEPTALTAQRSAPADPQLATLEEGFNRLVEVLESINENVVHQREQNSEMHKRLQELSSSLQGTAELGRMPEA